MTVTVPEVTEEFLDSLLPHLNEEPGPGPSPYLRISSEGVATTAASLKLTPRVVMQHLLEREIWPSRFCRNRGIFKAREQARLLGATAAVIGCGGLGGYNAALLARVGVGSLILCDCDCFDESNLNRQLFSRETNLGRNKAEVAAEEIASVASHVHTRVCPFAATAETLPAILAGADIVMDCLDSIAARLTLETIAKAMNIPLVYASIAGEEGFTMLTLTGTPGPAAIYGDRPATESGNAEKTLGAPTLIPAALAPLQVNLALRALLNRPTTTGSLYHLDISAPALDLLSF